MEGGGGFNFNVVILKIVQSSRYFLTIACAISNFVYSVYYLSASPNLFYGIKIQKKDVMLEKALLRVARVSRRTIFEVSTYLTMAVLNNFPGAQDLPTKFDHPKMQHVLPNKQKRDKFKLSLKHSL